MTRVASRKRARPATPIVAEEPPSPLIGAAAIVRGIVEHVTPGGMLCLATGNGFVWVTQDEVEIVLPVRFDADLFG